MTQTIAFIGTGIMGRPMAGHLQEAGHALRLVPHRSSAPDELLAKGARSCATPAEAAREADVVILMLPDTPDVEQVLFGTDGVLSGLTPGKLLIDMSSIDPIATRRFCGQVEDAGCDYVDAPVSGGELGARNATLTIMVGARDEAYARALPLLEAMGSRITHVGAPGAGQVTKVANQIVVALNIEAVAEALLFAAKAGVDPGRVREALLGGFASSRVLEVHGQRMVERTFAPGFRIELHRKDIGIALACARELDVALPNTAATAQLLNAAMAAGHGREDHSALVKVLEQLSDHELS